MHSSMAKVVTQFWCCHQCSKGVTQDLFILRGEKGLLHYFFSCLSSCHGRTYTSSELHTSWKLAENYIAAVGSEVFPNQTLLLPWLGGEREIVVVTPLTSHLRRFNWPIVSQFCSFTTAKGSEECKKYWLGGRGRTAEEYMLREVLHQCLSSISWRTYLFRKGQIERTEKAYRNVHVLISCNNKRTFWKK